VAGPELILYLRTHSRDGGPVYVQKIFYMRLGEILAALLKLISARKVSPKAIQKSSQLRAYRAVVLPVLAFCPEGPAIHIMTLVSIEK
jgi:hypothetical protein